MKLPVIRAFSDTYSVLFSNFGNVLKVAWLPFLLIALAYGWQLYESAKIVLTMRVPADADASRVIAALMVQLEPVTRWSYLINIFSFVMVAVITAGILRGLIRNEWPSVPFYIGSGFDDLRVLCVTFFALVINLAIALVAGVILVIAVMIAIPFQIDVLTALVVLVGVLGVYVALFWAALRLWVVAPNAIARHHLAFEDSWNMTSGNTWRLLAVAILVFLPIYVLFYGFLISMGLPLLPELGAEIAKVAEDPNAPPNVELGRDMLITLGMYFSASVVTSVVVTLVSIISSGVAYQLMTEESDNESVA